MTYKVEIRHFTGKTWSSWSLVGDQYITIKGARKVLYSMLITARYEGRIIKNNSGEEVGKASWAIARNTRYKTNNGKVYRLYRDGSIVNWYR